MQPPFDYSYNYQNGAQTNSLISPSTYRQPVSVFSNPSIVQAPFQPVPLQLQNQKVQFQENCFVQPQNNFENSSNPNFPYNPNLVSSTNFVPPSSSYFSGFIPNYPQSQNEFQNLPPQSKDQMQSYQQNSFQNSSFGASQFFQQARSYFSQQTSDQFAQQNFQQQSQQFLQPQIKTLDPSSNTQNKFFQETNFSYPASQNANTYYQCQNQVYQNNLFQNHQKMFMTGSQVSDTNTSVLQNKDLTLTGDTTQRQMNKEKIVNQEETFEPTQDLMEVVNQCFDQKFQIKPGFKVVPPSKLFKKLSDKTDDEIEKQKSSLNDKSKKIKSKYNNFTKLYLNTIFYLFKPINLENINYPEYLKFSLLQTIQKVKASGKKRMGKQFKTDHFNHSHYNVLFLKITENNIQRLSLNEKDHELHLSCFDIDLKKEDPKSKKIEFVNIIKRAIYQIVKLCISQDQIEIGQKTLNVKQQYQQKVLLGITKMGQGDITLRF